MTKQEAIEAMKVGRFISHLSFSSHEYIRMDENQNIVDEEDVVIDQEEFWRYRTSKTWENGYHFYCR